MIKCSNFSTTTKYLLQGQTSLYYHHVLRFVIKTSTAVWRYAFVFEMSFFGALVKSMNGNF